ncbi:hypothetical protein [Coprobacter sp.]|uniref:hypothetical protein n=1 Tax=Coprobacter sp. TaxID=1941478 RepID=UPI0025F6EE4D|nr:hypothetical protein [uncultured Coprobacter sp.]
MDKLSISINSHYRKLIQLNGSATANEVKNAIISLLELPKQIIEKYKGIAKDGKLLPMLSCGRLNENLQVIYATGIFLS